MKKMMALMVVAGLGLVAGCASSNRVENESAATEMKACEKGSACCKVTGNKADCKSDCSSAEKTCAEKSACEMKN